MPLELPNLDDRTYDDLVQEALSLIPPYAPEWTNYNPSDPGITLVELFAYLTEILIYRLNRVTLANQQAFLNLLSGGKYPQPLDEQILKTAIQQLILTLREGDRAVTPSDYERLALKIDSRVARARCVPQRNLEIKDDALKPGHISVVIVPKDDSELPDLLQKVRSELQSKRLLTTKVHVVSPEYVSFGVQLTLILKPDALANEVKQAAIETLTNFFDPLRGGQEKKGWEFGRNVYISEIYQLLDQISGIDYVQQRENERKEKLPEIFIINPLDRYRLILNETNQLTALEIKPNELVDFFSNEDDLVISSLKKQN